MNELIISLEVSTLGHWCLITVWQVCSAKQLVDSGAT